MVKNLTEGKPLKLLFFFALPMVIGNFFQQLYNMVDSMVVGKFVGEDALAAVGSSFPVVFLAVAIAAGLSMGCTVVISQLFGAGQIREMKTTISTALIALGVIGLAIMAAGELAAGPLLKLLGTDADIMADSLTYLRIYFGGAVFLFLYNTLNGIYNALGDSNTPLKFLMVSALTNIGLDLLFVIRFHMGVAGVAWATLIAQGLCAVVSFFVLIKRMKDMESEPAAADKKFAFFEANAARRIARVGVPSMLQQSIVSLSMMFMQGLVNSYGKVFVAGYTAATKIDTLAMMPNMNFSNAMSSYTAQNIGAGKDKRVVQGYKACLLMVLIFSLIITGIIYLFGPQLLSLFLNSGSEGSAMGYGLRYMKTVSVFYVLMGLMFVGNGLLRGAGDMGAFMLSSMSNLFSRVAIAYLLAHFIGSSAIWWSIPIGWGIGTIFSFIRVQSGKWKLKKLVD
nr:MATE family efflux transporter [uncultured Blautia sp.]